MGDGKVVGPFVAARVADDDVLVIGEGRDVRFPGWQHLLAKFGRHRIFPGQDSMSRRSRQSGRSRTIFSISTGWDPAAIGVYENAIGLDRHLDTDQCIRPLPNSGGNDGFRNRVGQAVGCPGETYSACWFMAWEAG